MESDLSKTFKVAFFTLLGLTIFFVALAVAFAFLVADPTKSQSSMESWLTRGATGTLSALLGLVGGKVA